MRILILGGAGITGNLVREYLSNAEMQVDYSSRHVIDDSHHRLFDLSGSRVKMLSLLSEYDWVISCIGPFEKWLDKAARMCVEAGVNYLDVNDSVEAREAILKVDAARANVTVLTGAGLCPGLSTALLMSESERSVEDIRVLLRIGKGQAAGKASVLSMFSTIYCGYRVLQNGQIQMVPHPQTPDEFIGYECPDMGSVVNLFPDIQNYRYYVGFSALTSKTICALQKKRLFTLPLVSSFLAKKASTSVTRNAAEKNDPQSAFLETTMVTGSRRTIVTLSGLTSYRFTALAAATCLKTLISNPLPPDVYEVASAPMLCAPLLEACRAQGANISVRREDA